MQNVTAAPSVGLDEESRTMEPIEQAAQATQRACGFADGGRHPEAAMDHAVRASVELMQRNAETVQHAFHCGARLAARLSERSTDQVGRAMGMVGEDADKVAHKTLLDVEAIVHCNAALTEITRCLSEEWVDLARARMDRGFDRLDAFLRCRTPQDFTALQSELIRDNMETLICYARKSGEHAARIAGEARQLAAGGNPRPTS